MKDTSSPISVLVADDSATIRSIVVDGLEASGLKLNITEAENGAGTLHALINQQIDIAFVDVQMPEMSGAEALVLAQQARIKAFIILMSSIGGSARLNLGTAVKAYEFLQKPFRKEDVVRLCHVYNRISTTIDILVVDDSETVRQLVSKVVASSLFDVKVVQAASGEAGMAAIKSKAFDVVFCDQVMPGMDGVEFIGRATEVNPACKFVLMTGKINDTVVRSAQFSGAAAVLPKPFFQADVNTVLHAVFGLEPSTIHQDNGLVILS